MLSLDLDVWRVFLHVIAATVWVGGQLVLAGLLPTLRSLGDDAPRQAARRFNTLAWPAFAVLVVTGVWNLFEIEIGDTSTEYQVTLGLKLLLVAASAIGALAHSNTGSRVVLAVGGAASAIGGIAALLLGVALSMGA
ncbi:MAG: CopD family protein [Actinomycetota bacterium]